MSMEPSELETISVPPSARRYLAELRSLGLLEGETGSRQINGGAQEVLRALHHVLGGGTVNVDIVSEGTGSVVDDLDTMLQDALHETNQVRDPEIMYF